MTTVRIRKARSTTLAANKIKLNGTKPADAAEILVFGTVRAVVDVAAGKVLWAETTGWRRSSQELVDAARASHTLSGATAKLWKEGGSA